MENTPRSEQFDDIYFSTHDGPGETAHVFFDGNDLPARWQGQDKRFTIAETGFGTGLNFLLAWELFDKTAGPDAFLDFISVEKYPLAVDTIRNGLSPWADRLEPYLSKFLAQYPLRVPGFHRMVFDGRVALTLIFDDANDALPEIEASVDAWFLDGFTPSKNPDMWTDKVFGEMARLSHAGTSFATFTAAGFVKRGLQAVGFAVEKKRGFGPKRDMLTGVFKSGVVKPAAAENISRDIVIHGAGLAGCAAAYVLKQYGFNPSLYDPNGIASGASGNSTGIINPRFTAFRSADSDFYTAAFAQATRTFPSFENIDYTACGSFHLITDEDKEKRLRRTIENWGWHDEHMRYLSPDTGSEVSGIKLDKEALYLPDSARLNPAALCRAYAADIPFLKEAPEEGALSIYACGVAVPGLPLHTVRGQVTQVRMTPASAPLKTNICYGGYIAPAKDGAHMVGATFQKWLPDSDIRDEDDVSNLEKLAVVLPAFSGFDIIGHRAALRTSSQDRFPVVGMMEDGRLVSTAHGSHGIATTLAAAHLLADFLRGGPWSLGKSTVRALSPQRFLNRKTNH